LSRVLGQYRTSRGSLQEAKAIAQYDLEGGSVHLTKVSICRLALTLPGQTQHYAVADLVHSRYPGLVRIWRLPFGLDI